MLGYHHKNHASSAKKLSTTSIILTLYGVLLSPKITLRWPGTSSPIIQELYPNSFLRSSWNALTLSGGIITMRPPLVSAEYPLVSLKSKTSELISAIPSNIGSEWIK